MRAAFAPLLADDTHGVVWVTDRPESYAVLTWGWSIEAGGPEAVLDEIFVSERGGGHGSALIEHLVADAEERGLARIFLETESHNDRARRFYERHGFVVDDSIWMSRDVHRSRPADYITGQTPVVTGQGSPRTRSR